MTKFHQFFFTLYRFHQHKDSECGGMGTLQWPCDSVPPHGAGRLHPSGGGVLPPETQWPQVTVAPPHVKRNCMFFSWSNGPHLLLDLLVPVLLLAFESWSSCNISIYILYYVSSSDYIWERYRSVWPRSNHISNGCAVCMESEAKGQDFLRESEVGHRVTRHRAEEDTLGLF